MTTKITYLVMFEEEEGVVGGGGKNVAEHLCGS